jgi:hypothetical protein
VRQRDSAAGVTNLFSWGKYARSGQASPWQAQGRVTIPAKVAVALTRIGQFLAGLAAGMGYSAIIVRKLFGSGSDIALFRPQSGPGIALADH